MEASGGMMKALVAGAGEGGQVAVVAESKAKAPRKIGATVEAAKAAGLPRIKVRDDGKRMILVSKEFIGELKQKPPRRIVRRFTNEHLLRMVRGDKAKHAILVGGYDAAEMAFDMESDILKQYDAMGHAYTGLCDD